MIHVYTLQVLSKSSAAVSSPKQATGASTPAQQASISPKKVGLQHILECMLQKIVITFTIDDPYHKSAKLITRSIRISTIHVDPIV